LENGSYGSVGIELSTACKIEVIVVFEEAMVMENQIINDPIKHTINLLREEARSKENHFFTYAEVAHIAFEEIEMLKKAEKISFAKICAAFAKNGVLAPNSNPYSFRLALRREKAWRVKLAAEKDTPDTGKKKNPNEDIPDLSALKSSLAPERKMPRSGRVVNTGTTRIVKNCDGSFDVLEDRFASEKGGNEQ